MLQIIIGKFFTSEDVHETPHTGVLFSNADFHGPIETCIGTLEPSVDVSGPRSLAYRVTERLENYTPDGQRAILASTGGREIVSDFASVAAFSLGVLVTPDPETARRLIGGTSGTSRNRLINLVPRVFDLSVDITPADRVHLTTFAEDLVGLRRSAFLAAMRAIRRYTLGLERLADEPDLAYSLLVASIESLAQKFDAFVPTWADIAQQRREPVDAALRDAPEDMAARVRGAILGTEHAALKRRFREFAIANVAPSFFREEALGSPRPAQRAELAPALDEAYQLRSKYIHTLRELPREMQIAVPTWDTTTIDHRPVLTFRGLARLARHVILQFVRNQPKVEHEQLNYWEELPNVLRLRMANRYWIWRAEN